MKDRRMIPSPVVERAITAVGAVIALLTSAGTLFAQELEPRAYAPSPVGSTFVL